MDNKSKVLNFVLENKWRKIFISNFKIKLAVAIIEYVVIEDDFIEDIKCNRLDVMIVEIHNESSEKYFSYSAVMIAQIMFSITITKLISILTKSGGNIFQKVNEFSLDKKPNFLKHICLNWKTKKEHYFNKDIKQILMKDKQFVVNSRKFSCFGIYKTKKIASEKESLKLTAFHKKKSKKYNLLKDNSHIFEIHEKIIAHKLEMDFQIQKENEQLLFVGSKLMKKVLLGPARPENKYKKCCVIDLDETLVHSSFQELSRYDFKINVEVDGIYHDIYILKRPYVDLFLTRVSTYFECVLFTASLSKYAKPVANLLSKGNTFQWKLYRDDCIFYKGGFVKDLSILGRPLDQIVIIDNSPVSFLFQPENAIQIISWFDDVRDRALLDLIPYLQRLSQSQSVLEFLRTFQPPMTATWPVSIFSQTSSKSLQSESFLTDSVILNNLITSTRRKDTASFKKSINLSRTNLNKTPVNNGLSLRSLFFKKSTAQSSDKLININPTPSTSKESGQSDIINSTSFPIKLSRNLLNDDVSSKRFTIKQNLNSASEIFSPQYHDIRHIT